VSRRRVDHSKPHPFQLEIPRAEPSPAALDDRAARAAALAARAAAVKRGDGASVTAAFFGEPLPGPR
jgi:hypothetical protein